MGANSQIMFGISTSSLDIVRVESMESTRNGWLVVFLEHDLGCDENSGIMVDEWWIYGD